MQRSRLGSLAGVGLAVMTMACDASDEELPPGSADAAARIDAAARGDADVAVDAPTADAYAGACAPERTRHIYSLVAAVPTCTPHEAQPVEVGSYCDDILTYASTPEQRAAVEAAAPGFACDPASGYCSFQSPGGSGIQVTDEVMAQLCAASVVVEPGCFIDCLVYI